jgi:hypothetical protein
MKSGGGRSRKRRGEGGRGGYISGIAQAGGEEKAAKERQRCAGREGSVCGVAVELEK